ncbi:hypothetical protein HDU96_007922, partial [Phlyctochytrium bullatum]
MHLSTIAVVTATLCATTGLAQRAHTPTPTPTPVPSVFQPPPPHWTPLPGTPAHTRAPIGTIPVTPLASAPPGKPP